MALVYHGPLRFGLFHAPFHSKRLNPTYALERDLLLTEHLDRLGFEEIWYGEHHSGGMEMIAAPELMIAAAAQRTKYIRLGTGVKSLPYHHPFMLAEAMAQLDHMTRGRAIFGVGPGALPSDAVMMGIPPTELRPRMEESLDTIIELFKGETVTRRTDWFELQKARLSVGCFSKPMMELAVTTIRSPAGVVAAARRGLGLLTLGPTLRIGAFTRASAKSTDMSPIAANGALP
jgi:limonene 1,2-monooxygenase